METVEYIEMVVNGGDNNPSFSISTEQINAMLYKNNGNEDQTILDCLRIKLVRVSELNSVNYKLGDESISGNMDSYIDYLKERVKEYESKVEINSNNYSFSEPEDIF
jgi:hypothetical protein